MRKLGGIAGIATAPPAERRSVSSRAFSSRMAWSERDNCSRVFVVFERRNGKAFVVLVTFCLEEAAVECPASDLGFRISFGFRPSAFGFPRSAHLFPIRQKYTAPAKQST